MSARHWPTQLQLQLQLRAFTGPWEWQPETRPPIHTG